LSQTGIFGKNQRLAHLDFEPKFIFFKAHKNLYTGQLSVTNSKYGLYNQEIRSFGQFLPQSSIFGKIEG
jgi:hypothetical protein